MIVDELKNMQEWEDFLRVNQGTFYHSLKWKSVLEKSFSVAAAYFVIKDADEKLVGVCPTFLMSMGRMRILDSLPFSDFGGPVVDRRYVRAATFSLQKYLYEYSYEKGISYVKICLLKNECQEFFKSLRCCSSDVKGVVELDLFTHPLAFIWETIFRKKQRKKIRSLERHGFQVREASTPSDLGAFLATYYQNMAHLGVQAYPHYFFETVWNMLHPKNFRILILEEKNIVGGLAFYIYSDTIYLAYLGIDRNLLSTLSRAYSVAPFLYWQVIKWADRNGFKHICFGSTPTHPKNESEIANYSQKIMFGGSFKPQETVSIPFAPSAHAFLLLQSGLTGTWRAVKRVMPRRLQDAMQNIGDLP